MDEQKPYIRFVDGEPEAVNDKDGILEFLLEIREATGGRGRDYFDWFLRNGEYFEIYHDPLPKKVKEIIENQANFCDTEARNCFGNSQGLVMDSSGEYPYYEGYGMTHEVGIPLEHAWSVDSDNTVIDLTWIPQDFRPVGYFGVKIPFEYVAKRIVEGSITSLRKDYYREEVE